MNTLTLSSNDPTPDRSIAAVQAFERANAAQDGQDGASISAEQNEPERAHWSSARKPFWWAFFATIVISAIGSMAIYFIHRTTPVTTPSPQITTIPKAKAAGAIDHSLLASPPAVSMPAANIPAAGIPAINVPATGTQVQRNSASTKDATLSRNQPPSTSESGKAELSAKGNQTGKANANAPSQSIQWSATPARAETARKENQGANGRAIDPSNGASNDANKTLNQDVNKGPAITANSAKAKNEPKPAARNSGNESAPSFAPRPVRPGETATNPQKRENPATNVAPVAAAGGASANATGAVSGRLRAAQDAQCGDANFFQRLVCDERVKQRFCRDRWNDHQDCALQKPRDL